LSDIPGFQTKAEIKTLLDGHAAAPRKRYGQCFLIDRNLMERVLATAEVSSRDWVLEVGCGTGSLTGELLRRAGRVVGVEIDKALQVILADRYGQVDHFSLLAEDVLAKKSALAPSVIDAMAVARAAVDGRGMLVANLPYDVATSLLIELLLGDFGIERFVFTVQLEMAERLRAAANTDAYGAVSVIAQSMARVAIVAKLPPQAFWPAPKVQSAIVKMERVSRDKLPIDDPRGFAKFVRTVFQSRRKGLLGTLKRMGQAGSVDFSGNLEELLTEMDISPQIRPEAVSLETWWRLMRQM